MNSTASRASLLAALFAAACASVPPSSRTNQPTPDQPPPRYIPATRPKSDCAAEMARTSSWTLTDTVGMQRPLLRVLVIMPRPAPPAVTSVRIDVRVSEDGSVMPDSIWLDGIADRAYESRVRQAVRGYRFWPAVLDGCAVSARAWVRAGINARR